jgi:hypothetical protein
MQYRRVVEKSAYDRDEAERLAVALRDHKIIGEICDRMRLLMCERNSPAATRRDVFEDLVLFVSFTDYY